MEPVGPFVSLTGSRRAAKKTRAGHAAKTAKTAQSARMGRRSLLSDQLREWIEGQLAEGVAQVVIAQRAGVSTRSLRRWISTGQVRRPEPTLPAPADSWRIAAELLERAFPRRWGRRDADAGV